MPWHLTDDVELYAEQVGDQLRADPEQNTIALTVIENVRDGVRWSSEPMLFGWYDASPVLGAVSMTPPHTLHLGCLPDGSAGELVSALQARGARIPGVNGEAGAVDRFLSAWTAQGTSDMTSSTTTSRAERLYALGTLRSPDPMPAGEPRLARDDELDTLVAWVAAFQAEAGVTPTDVESAVRDRVSSGLLWVWEGADGAPVSLAARNRTAAGVARVGPVYTPPEHRRRGYGAAVTAACTRDALDRGADNVVLFTDLANPTSNAIYQQIGFRPLRGHKFVSFDGLLTS